MSCIKNAARSKRLLKLQHHFGYIIIFLICTSIFFFKTPQKDTCKKCDTLQIKIQNSSEEESEIYKHEKKLHQVRAQSVRDALKENMKNDSPESKVITFDLQKTLPLPHLQTNEIYYKRQLNMYNLGIHSYPENQVVMNIWTEDEGKRGAEDIASCILEYCEANITEGQTNLITFSDACGGGRIEITLWQDL